MDVMVAIFILRGKMENTHFEVETNQVSIEYHQSLVLVSIECNYDRVLKHPMNHLQACLSYFLLAKKEIIMSQNLFYKHHCSCINGSLTGIVLANGIESITEKIFSLP